MGVRLCTKKERRDSSLMFRLRLPPTTPRTTVCETLRQKTRAPMWAGWFVSGYIPLVSCKVAAMAVALVKRVFQKHPFVSNCVVYGTLYVGAEFSQQTLSRKILSKKEPPEPYDIGSLARYAVVGSTVYPTMLHNWYLNLFLCQDIQSTLVQPSMSLEFEKYTREKQTLTVTPVGRRTVIGVATKLVLLVATYFNYDIVYGDWRRDGSIVQAESNGNPRPYDMNAMARYGLLGLCFYPQVYYFCLSEISWIRLLKFNSLDPYQVELLVLASRSDNQLPIGPPSSTGGVCGIMCPHLGQHPLLVQTARLLKTPFLPQQQYRPPRRHRFLGERK
ncbi:unnamed protein product [Timema podura]|uniref:Mpv17-like protein n=1 Tax=Timema podura TaxID=61482 RepID=A0ABN7NPB4_TIMPD|nr:unnamed protein product [Timema podura]